jgi:hypothetical protein
LDVSPSAAAATYAGQVSGCHAEAFDVGGVEPLDVSVSPNEVWRFAKILAEHQEVVMNRGCRE